jgi:hypothetical protein
MDPTSTTIGAPRQGRRRRRGAALAAIVALTAVGVMVWPSGGSDRAPDHRGEAAASPTTVSAPPASAAAPVAAAPAPAPAAAAPAPAPKPKPVLQDGRHPVYLTDVDVPGSTVEFDLLRYLATDEEREAYEHSHPSEYGEDGHYESPFRNENPRLRRLPVAHDVRIVVQRTDGATCDGPHSLDFAGLSENVRGLGVPGHLGVNPFWLTVRHGDVVALDEVPCMG